MKTQMLTQQDDELDENYVSWRALKRSLRGETKAQKGEGLLCKSPWAQALIWGPNSCIHLSFSQIFSDTSIGNEDTSERPSSCTSLEISFHKMHKTPVTKSHLEEAIKSLVSPALGFNRSCS